MFILHNDIDLHNDVCNDEANAIPPHKDGSNHLECYHVTVLTPKHYRIATNAKNVIALQVKNE